MPHAVGVSSDAPGQYRWKPRPDQRPPFTQEDIREMYRDGDSVTTIIQRLRVRQGMARQEVREVLFGQGY